MSSDPDTPSSATPHQGALIQPVPIERVVAETQRWSANDRSFTQRVSALDAAISGARKDMSARQLSPTETPGAVAASAQAAIGAIESARHRVTNAAQARTESRAALQAARDSAERALADASDVLVARRAIAAIVLVLLALALLVAFRG